MTLKESCFITIEGGEGVGKSSFIVKLKKYLEEKNLQIELTREPGGTKIAEKIREIFCLENSESLTIESELFLISAARAQHLKHKIIPWLQAKRIVLCDRFIDSTRVYQGKIGKINDKVIEQVLNSSCFGIEPSLTFLLDCPVNIALQRLSHRSSAKKEKQTDRYDKAHKTFHEKVRDEFLILAKKFKDRFVIIDSTKSPEHMLETALKAMTSKAILP